MEPRRGEGKVQRSGGKGPHSGTAARDPQRQGGCGGRSRGRVETCDGWWKVVHRSPAEPGGASAQPRGSRDALRSRSRHRPSHRSLSFLLDTNVVSEPTHVSPAHPVLAWLASRSPDELFVSTVTIGEVRYGIEICP